MCVLPPVWCATPSRCATTAASNTSPPPRYARRYHNVVSPTRHRRWAAVPPENVTAYAIAGEHSDADSQLRQSSIPPQGRGAIGSDDAAARSPRARMPDQRDRLRPGDSPVIPQRLRRAASRWWVWERTRFVAGPWWRTQPRPELLPQQDAAGSVTTVADGRGLGNATEVNWAALGLQRPPIDVPGAVAVDAVPLTDILAHAGVAIG